MGLNSSQWLMKLFVVTTLFQVSFGSSRLFQVSLATRKLSELVQDQTQLLKYHNGPLLSGKITINLIWYGNFKPSQKAIVSDFISSLSSSSPSKTPQPSVAAWWQTTEKYYHLTSNKKSSNSLSLSLGRQILDQSYSLGKSLTTKQIVALAAKGDQKNAINVVLTSADVALSKPDTPRAARTPSSLTFGLETRKPNARGSARGHSTSPSMGPRAHPL
ncbi:hypothetical protein ACFX13_044776 [Malus domestica]